MPQKVSEYDQELPQSHTKTNPWQRVEESKNDNSDYFHQETENELFQN